MTLLYGRRLGLAFADKEGKALDVSQLQVQFSVSAFDLQTPCSADIRIFNVADATALKMTKEFTRIILQAGYGDLFGTIFDGTIVQTRRGRTNPVDTYVDVTAGDGDLAHNFAVVNTTIAAGATPNDRYQALLASLKPHGVTAGTAPNLVGPALPRGRVFYGMVRDHLRDLAQATDTVWNIRDGKLEFTSHNGYSPCEAVVLTPATGLVGLPQQTQDGIMVRSLLNPLYKVGGRVQLMNSSIQQLRLPVEFQSGDKVVDYRNKALVPTLDGQGIYRILAVNHSGDSRGQPWYSDLECVALDGTVPVSQVQKRGAA